MMMTMIMMIIIIAVSGDRRLIKKESENILQHKDLTIEVHRMWKCQNKSGTSKIHS
jgi:hypothetical protein